MSGEVLTIKQTILEDVEPWFMARVVNGLGVPLVRADVVANGVYLRVYNLSASDPNTVVGIDPSLDPSTSYRGYPLMTDTLQTTGWHVDSVGRNLMYVPSLSILDASARHGGCVLRWSFELQLVIGGTTFVVFETPIKSVKSA